MRGSETVLGKRIRCWDNGGRSADRYTVAWPDEKDDRRGTVSCLCMSESPFHPQGVGMHGDCVMGRHLGKRVPFSALPADCRRAVEQDCGSGAPEGLLAVS